MILNKYDKMFFVVARYKEDVKWLDNNKGYVINKYFQPELNNAGGNESHSYVHWIIKNYDSLPEWICFTQGDPFSNGAHIDVVLDNFKYDTKFLQFGSPFSHDLNNKTGWTHEITKRIEVLVKELNLKIPEGWGEFTTGSKFIVHRDLIKNYPLDWWNKFFKYLCISKGPDMWKDYWGHPNSSYYGHAAERLWGIIFGSLNLEVEKKIKKPLNKLRLSKADGVTELILEKGLNNEFPHEMPEIYHKYMKDTGYRIWQNPTEFSKYLVWLKSRKISKYLEIGVRYAGSFIFTMEYLNLYGDVIGAGIDIEDVFPSDTPYDLRVMDSTSEEFIALATKFEPDVTFIDGDHGYDGVRKDLDNALKYTKKYIVLHDIQNINCPGVTTLWEDLQHKKEYTIKEFRDPKYQYFGIGVIIL